MIHRVEKYDWPVNKNLVSYPLTSKEKRSVKLLLKLRPKMDEEHAIEFIRIFYYEIRTSPGGVEGLLKKMLL